MIGRLDIAHLNRACAGHDLQRNIFAAHERLWRSKTGAHDRTAIPDQIQPDKPSLLLEHERIADSASVAAAKIRQDESSADVGMAGKR